MILNLWDSAVGILATLGYSIDTSESNALVDKAFTIKLPGDGRDERASTFARARVMRDFRVRVQFREQAGNPRFPLEVSMAVETIVDSFHTSGLFLFESWVSEPRQGGVVAEIRFSSRDSMS